MKQLFIAAFLCVFIGCADVVITPGAKINESFFSSVQERQDFDLGIIKGDFNRISSACVDVLKSEGYPVEAKNKPSGIIKGGPKSTENGAYYVKCTISEMSKGTYRLKWSFTVDMGTGAMIVSDESADGKKRDTFSQEWNYAVFCKMKGYVYK